MYSLEYLNYDVLFFVLQVANPSSSSVSVPKVPERYQRSPIQTRVLTAKTTMTSPYKRKLQISLLQKRMGQRVKPKIRGSVGGSLSSRPVDDYKHRLPSLRPGLHWHPESVLNQIRVRSTSSSKFRSTSSKKTKKVRL